MRDSKYKKIKNKKNKNKKIQKKNYFNQLKYDI